METLSNMIIISNLSQPLKFILPSSLYNSVNNQLLEGDVYARYDRSLHKGHDIVYSCFSIGTDFPKDIPGKSARMNWFALLNIDAIKHC